MFVPQNDLFSAVSDIRSVNRLQQDSTAGYFRLASLLYQLGHVSDALKVRGQPHRTLHNQAGGGILYDSLI